MKQKFPRNLQNEELIQLHKQVQESIWDEGVIQTYMQRSDIQSIAYDLKKGHTLILTSHLPVYQNNAVAEELDRILMWLEPDRPFQVFLWLRDDPRSVKANEWPSRRSINGGWTIPGSSAICVYREEEWERVVLHEMIHALEWDWKMPTQPDACWSVHSGIYTPALFEAWTELLAEWFWCAWKSVSWPTQRKWQEFQALQILARHYRTNSLWKENTSVFSYYILKTTLAPHMPFLWIHYNGDTEDERKKFLCKIVPSELHRLEKLAEKVIPTEISLCMTIKKDNNLLLKGQK